MGDPMLKIEKFCVRPRQKSENKFRSFDIPSIVTQSVLFMQTRIDLLSLEIQFASEFFISIPMMTHHWWDQNQLIEIRYQFHIHRDKKTSSHYYHIHFKNFEKLTKKRLFRDFNKILNFNRSNLLYFSNFSIKKNENREKSATSTTIFTCSATKSTRTCTGKISNLTD